ncbi:MAG: hypothetical protein M1812_004632 [Candelaria pacifica]|nr:MAG: hypothetical protein M1812_004632 [Candelaria pacifica]
MQGPSTETLMKEIKSEKTESETQILEIEAELTKSAVETETDLKEHRCWFGGEFKDLDVGSNAAITDIENARSPQQRSRRTDR